MTAVRTVALQRVLDHSEYGLPETWLRVPAGGESVCAFEALKTRGGGRSDNGGSYKPRREVYCCGAEAGQHADTPKYLEGKNLWRHR